MSSAPTPRAGHPSTAPASGPASPPAGRRPPGLVPDRRASRCQPSGRSVGRSNVASPTRAPSTSRGSTHRSACARSTRPPPSSSTQAEPARRGTHRHLCRCPDRTTTHGGSTRRHGRSRTSAKGGPDRLVGVRGHAERGEDRLDRLARHRAVPALPVPEVGRDAVRGGQLQQVGGQRVGGRRVGGHRSAGIGSVGIADDPPHQQAGRAPPRPDGARRRLHLRGQGQQPGLAGRPPGEHHADRQPVGRHVQRQRHRRLPGEVPGGPGREGLLRGEVGGRVASSRSAYRPAAAAGRGSG